LVRYIKCSVLNKILFVHFVKILKTIIFVKIFPFPKKKTLIFIKYLLEIKSPLNHYITKEKRKKINPLSPTTPHSTPPKK